MTEQKPDIYGIEDLIIDSLYASLGKISNDRQHDLEMALTSCPLLHSVLRRYIMLLSGNVRSNKREMPLCHEIIALALEKIYGTSEDGSDLLYPDLTPNRELWQFCSCLADLTIKNFSFRVSFRDWSWDLEKAFADGDYLFRHLIVPGDEVAVTPYQIKNPEKLHIDIMQKLLSPKVYKTLKSDEDPDFTLTNNVSEIEIQDPVFTIISGD